MSSRSQRDVCRVCGGALRGNQRRWLFSGQNRKSGRPETPSGGRSLSRSSHSSPWGSTLSLGSLSSLSRSHSSLSSPSKAVDVLAVLTHILGQAVPRGGQLGEFLCGKCVCLLERVFKFDSVISRVRQLSSERLVKLTEERDKIRQWVRQRYHQRHPGEAGARRGEDGGEEEKEGYREMLRDNMELSQYECWSQKWDTCPYFIRTGKRCRGGKGCEGCDSLRVADSDYESVCGVPRHLPFQPFSPLSRDKSVSMPLCSVSSSPASLAGSCLSLRTSSRAGSVQSVDSLDANEAFEPPWERSLDFLLQELRGLEGRAISSPSGSRIPVLGRHGDRWTGRHGGRLSSATPSSPASPRSPPVSRTLSFRGGENGVEDGDGAEDRDGEDRHGEDRHGEDRHGEDRHGEDRHGEDSDVLTELRDEFMPLHRETSSSRVHHAIRHLRGQLDQALSRVRTLEEELKQSRDTPTEDTPTEDTPTEDTPTEDTPTEVNGLEEWKPLQEGSGGGGGIGVLQSLGSSLHSRERLIQECVSVIRRLSGEEAAGKELTVQLSQSLKEIQSEHQASLESLRRDSSEREEVLQKEVEELRAAGRSRDADLDLLNAVLQGNQDVINELREALGQEEQRLKEAQEEKELWRQRDAALNAVLMEKDALIGQLEELLDVCRKELPSGGGTKLSAWLKDREADSATLCQEVTKLTSLLQEYQDTVQTQQESHRHTLSSLTNQLQDARRLLRQRQKEERERSREREREREEREREERRLRESLQKRDRLLEQILQDAEQRDLMVRELQQSRRQPVTAVKHTL